MLGTIELAYMAAPVGAPTVAEVDANIARAVRWNAFLLDAAPDLAIIAPWLATLLGGVQHDHVPEHRARGLRDNLVAARRCDGIILVAGRISSGMTDELGVLLGTGGWVCDLTRLGLEPPPVSAFAPGGVIQLGRAAWAARR